MSGANLYRFAIVGAGMIAEWHARAIAELPNAELTAVCDHGSGKAGRVGPRCECRNGCDLERLLARADVDVVAVATPSGTHAQISEQAARHGKHCLVEKPLDVTLEAVDRMIAAHERAGTFLGGIFNQRYTATAQLLKQAVEAGRFGRLTFGTAYCPWWRDQAYYDEGGWKGTQALDGGGAMMNQGIHAIDLLQWLMGPVKRVTAMTGTLAHERIDVEDTGVAAVEFRNGALGLIACTTSMYPGHFRMVEVAGVDGTVSLADNNFLCWQFRREAPEDRRIQTEHRGLPPTSLGAADPSAGFTVDSHRENFAAFLSALEAATPPAIDGREARKAVEIVLAIYESARRGGAPVELSAPSP